MKPAQTASTPLHFIVVGEPTWRCVREWRQRAKEIAGFYPGATCHIWHGEALHKRIRGGFGEEVVAAVHGLSSADAATLASWCLLHLFGGMFHASGLRLLAPMTIPDGAGIAAFNDVRPTATGWTAITPALLWSRAGRDEWALAVDMKVKALRDAPSGLPSDDVILGHAIGQAAVKRGGRGEDDQWIGQVKAIPGTGGDEDQAFVAPDGTIVALLETP